LYAVDIHHPRLTGLLADLWSEITRVALEARSELRRRGYALPQLEGLRRDGVFLPVDVMVAAMRAGIAADFQAVVRVLVEEMGISFAAGADMVETVAAAHAAGGVAVLAHPGRAEFGFTRAEPTDVAEMIEAAGLDGIEVYHWSHGPAAVETYGRLAAERGLLVSCGSDSHGPQSLRRLRGWEARLCRELLERCGVAVAGVGRGERTGSDGA
jgi:predicted metal-dependent phosphoesterase TrpH